MKKKGSNFKEKIPLSKTKLNPFEVHINHSKHKILGQKSKDDHGLPGVSRGKAYRKREKTLLNEYRDRHKNSKFLDLRIGEKNKFLDPEKKIMLRMAAEKKRQFSKKSLYNLNDDEQLMHGGEALNEATMKDNAFSDDEEDDLLDADFVNEQHFGGDIFTKHKQTDQDSEGHPNSGNKTKKEWIEELIAESKKKKADGKRDKEIQSEAVTKLDSKFQDFLSLLKGRILTDDDKEKSKNNCEFRDYDTLVRESAFDRSKRANPMNRLKTVEELAKEEEEKLRKLEDERQRRMNGDFETNYTSRQSADALDDGLVSWSSKKDENLKPRKMSSVHVTLNGRTKDGAMNKEDDDEATSESESEGEEEEESSEEESDNYSDVLEDSNSEEGNDQGDEEEEDKDEPKRRKKSSKLSEEGTADNDVSVAEAEKELPFTFEVPRDYDGFWDLVQGRSPPKVSTILDRMITCNHPKLGADNKNKANTINAYILQTLHILCSEDPECVCDGVHPLSYIEPLIPHLYALTQLNPPDSASAITQVIDEKYEEYSKNPKKYPFADTYIFLKICGLLYPSSDYHHDVMTRVLTFLTQILGDGKVSCGRDLVALLFTASLLFEYLSRSGRFVGELLNALNSVLFTAIPSKGMEDFYTSLPFRVLGQSLEILVLGKRARSYKSSKLKFSMINEEIEMKDNLKITVLNETLKLMDKICQKWSNLSSVRALFLPTKELLQRIPLEKYPTETETLVHTLQTAISNLPKQIPRLVKLDSRVRTLKMFEPVAEEIIEGIKKRSGGKALQEKNKLLHKLKRERKGAKRELKRDAQFIARQQLSEVLASDAERKRKVNLIIQGLATQESEFKKMKKYK